MSQDTIAGFDRAARLSQAEIAALVAAAVAALREGIRRSEILAALAQRSPAPIFESAAWDDLAAELAKIYGPDGPLSKTMKSAARSALRTPAIKGATDFSFDAVFARSRDWLDREGGRLITAVSEGTREAIREVVKNAFAEPLGIRDAARNILDIKGFGLNRPQSRSFNRWVEALLSRQVEGSENLSGEQIQRLIDARYKKMLKQRARLIAKTESRNAAAAAQRELWSEAVDQGLLDADAYVLEWVTRVIRVCPRCIALAGAIAEINGGDFTSANIEGGGRFDGTQIVVTRPTVHPDCYCALRVRRRPKARAEASRFAA